MADVKVLFGKRVRKFRQKQGLSQEELAEKIDIALNNLGKIERGESFVTAQTLEKLSQALNVEIKDLFTFEDYKDSKSIRKELNLEILDDKNLQLIYKIFNVIKNF